MILILHFDPQYYDFCSAPGLAWVAALKMTEIKFEVC